MRGVHIPEEIAGLILSNLDVKEIFRASRINKTFHLASSSEEFWGQRLREDWTTSIPIAQQADSEAVDEEAQSLQPLSNRKQYAMRWKQLSQWMRKAQHASNNPFHILFLGCYAIICLFLSAKPSDFVTPQFLHRDFLEQHYQNLRNVTIGAQFILSLLAIAYVSLYLLLLFPAHIAIRVSLTIAIVILTLIRNWTKFQKVESSMCLKITLGVDIAIVVLLYFTIAAIQWHSTHSIVLYLSILQICFPLSILHGASVTLPSMMFETHSTSSSSAAHLLLVADENRTVWSDRFNREHSTLSRYTSIPLDFILGLAMGTGGFRFLLELVLWIIIFIITAIFGGSLALDNLEIFKSTGVVALYLILVALVVTFVLAVLHLKMIHCSKLQQLDMEMASQKRELSVSIRRKQLKTRMFVIGLLLLSLLLLIAHLAITIGLVYQGIRTISP